MRKSKLTIRQRLDVDSMRYFIPTGYEVVITDDDIYDMSMLSSKGIQPQKETRGYKALKIGKMYRDEQITSWKDGINQGLVTKGELLDDIPQRLKKWLHKKIEHTPYDIEGEASKYFLAVNAGKLTTLD